MLYIDLADFVSNRYSILGIISLFEPGMDNLGLDPTKTDRDRPILDRVEPNRYDRFGPVQVQVLICPTDWIDRLDRHTLSYI